MCVAVPFSCLANSHHPFACRRGQQTVWASWWYFNHTFKILKSYFVGFYISLWYV